MKLNFNTTNFWNGNHAICLAKVSVVVVENWNGSNRFLYYVESWLNPINRWWSDPYWNSEYFQGTGKYSMIWWWPVLNSWIFPWDRKILCLEPIHSLPLALVMVKHAFKITSYCLDFFLLVNKLVKSSIVFEVWTKLQFPTITTKRDYTLCLVGPYFKTLRTRLEK